MHEMKFTVTLVVNSDDSVDQLGERANQLLQKLVNPEMIHQMIIDDLKQEPVNVNIALNIEKLSAEDEVLNMLMNHMLSKADDEELKQLFGGDERVSLKKIKIGDNHEEVKPDLHREGNVTFLQPKDKSTVH